MAERKYKTTGVADQQEALTVYLEALLKEVGFGDPVSEPVTDNQPCLDETVDTVTTSVAEVLPVPVPRPMPSPAPSNTGTELIPRTETIPRPSPVIDTFQTVDDNEFALAHEKIEEQQGEEAADVPDWARARFQCLMFSIAGLKVAAPLEKLNGIVEWPESLTILPGHAEWFLGLHRNRNQNVQVIDLAQILNTNTPLPEDNTPVFKRAKYIMLIDDGRIGLVSDTVADMMTLEAGDVKWRSSSGSGSIQLIAGTVIDKMCSLLDVDSLIEHINQS